MTPPVVRRRRLILVAALATVSSLAAWWTTPRPRLPDTTRARGPLVIALAGDAAVSAPLDAGDHRVRAMATLLQNASLTVANFELSTPAVAMAEPVDAPRWPAAIPQAAAQLHALGVRAVSLANNHAFDFGVEGVRHVQQLLDDAGVRHAGSGENLEEARAPAFVSTGSGTVALIAVTLSTTPGARATASTGDIQGRPGVNGIRYARRLTVDPATFARLREAFQADVMRANADGQTWDLFGVTVEVGARSRMTLVPDAEDLNALAASVQSAQQRSAAVVVSLHAHEPGNGVEDVPELLRTVAHTAIDAGAHVVAGHGPHRLRGVELYRERPIFYSLGNFIFPDRDVQPEAADEFEDADRNVLSPFGEGGSARADSTDDVWREGLVAFVTLEAGRVSRIVLHPIDLGIGQERRRRGVPQPAAASTAAAIVSRVQKLSRPLGVTINVEEGVGVVALVSR